MYKNILVPIDLAQPAGGSEAVALAGRLCESSDAKIRLLYVIPEVPKFVTAELPSDSYDKARAFAEAGLRRFADQGNLPPEVEKIVRVGHPYPEILAIAKDSGTDLIIVASHKPGLGDYFLGSVAAKVVRHAQCSVLVQR